MNNRFFYLTKFLKKLEFTLFKSWGRDYYGKIVSFHKGNSLKFRYKSINFFNNLNVSGFFIDKFLFNNKYFSCILTFSGIAFYSLASETQKCGDILFFGEDLKRSLLDPFVNGSSFPIKYMSKNYIVSCLEIYPGSGVKLVRSSGNFSIILDNNLISNEVILLLNSGWKIKVSGNCFASLGQINNSVSDLKKKNAGFNRNLGIRPTVRGVAMNPVDHPHGGGEGRTSGGRPSVSPWGILTKGLPTVGNKRRFIKSVYSFVKK